MVHDDIIYLKYILRYLNFEHSPPPNVRPKKKNGI